MHNDYHNRTKVRAKASEVPGFNLVWGGVGFVSLVVLALAALIQASAPSL